MTIEQKFEKDIKANRAKLDQKFDGEIFGGLHNGISHADVASNVTLHIEGENKVFGGKMNTDGRLSLKDYGTISMQDTKRSWCAIPDMKASSMAWNSSRVHNEDLHSASGKDFRIIKLTSTDEA